MLKAKAERGERLGTRAPYGYIKDPETKKLAVDDEAAAIVRRIFAMCASGNGPSQIARILKKEQVLTPTMYAYTRYGMNHTCLDTAHPYNWSDSAIANLLENEIYLGNTVNMKYSTKSYKDKRRVEHSREECLVFKDTHPALITQEVWDIVQRVRKNRISIPVLCSAPTAAPTWCCTGRIPCPPATITLPVAPTRRMAKPVRATVRSG